MRSGARVLAMALATTMAACSAILGLDGVDYDASDAATTLVDGATEGGREAGVDGRSEAEAPADADAEAAVDARAEDGGDGGGESADREDSGDSGDGGDGGCASTWCSCQPHHSLCEDFDDFGEGGIIGSPVWGVSINNGSVVLDDVGALSPPYSVRFSIPILAPMDGGSTAAAPQISRTAVAAHVASFSCALDMWIVQDDTRSTAQATTFLVALADTNLDVFALYHRPGTDFTQWRDTPTAFKGGPPDLYFPSGWFRYQIMVAPVASEMGDAGDAGDASAAKDAKADGNAGDAGDGGESGPMYVWTGGVVAANTTPFSVMLPGFVNDNHGFSITLGLAQAIAYHGGTSILIDNLTCDW